VRRKSPRAPSISLDEAVERAMRAYEKEGRHAAPTEVIAQDIGYKSANSGAALSAIASLRYYGLLERPSEGKLAVTKDVESYKFSPSEVLRGELLVKWLKSPPVFADLLERYQNNLPSDASIRYDLIQRGFSPIAAASVLGVFQRSVQFARYFESLSRDAPPVEHEVVQDPITGGADSEAVSTSGPTSPQASDRAFNDLDRIPVRLSGNRRAFLLVPTPFYIADKSRLKAQIDLLLTDDEAADNA
jgi:hypothetical protein